MLKHQKKLKKPKVENKILGDNSEKDHHLKERREPPYNG